MKGNRLLQVAGLVLMAGVIPLVAQGYETKFKAIGHKPGDVYQSDEGVNVSLSGGGLEISLPLGPAIPGPIPIRPVVQYHGKFSQGMNNHWYYTLADEEGALAPLPWPPGYDPDGVRKEYKRYLPPNLPHGEVHPGYLLFRAGSTGGAVSESDLVVNSPFGKSTCYYVDMPGAVTYTTTSPGDINTLAYMLAPEWNRNITPLNVCNAQGTPTQSLPSGTLGVRLSGGTILIFGDSSDTIFSLSDDVAANSTLVSIPREILQIDGDLIILWRRSRNVYNAEFNRMDPRGINHARYRWNQSVFHPVWIKTRSGFKVNVQVYRAAAGGLKSCLSEGGILTGYKVSTADGGIWFQVGGPEGSSSVNQVSFGGMGVSIATGPGFDGHTPPRTDGLGYSFPDFWQPGTTAGWEHLGPANLEQEWTSASLNIGGGDITYAGLTTSLQWAGPLGLLSGLTTPSGKTYAFTYELKQGTGVRPSVGGSSARWNFDPNTPGVGDFWSVDSEMKVSGGGQTRTSAYHWAIPTVNSAVSQPPTLGPISWSTRHQGVAQTLPDGQTILHVFTPVMDLPSSPSTEQWARTFMAQRQTPIARYYYAAGETGWNGFITSGTDPASSNWYKRELMEGFDLRAWEASLTQITSNTEPRPTRTIQEEKGGPVEVMELEGWDASRSQYAVSRIYHLTPGTFTAGQFWAPGLFSGNGSYSPVSGAIDLVTTTTTFAPVEAGLFARPQEKVTQQVVAPPSGTTGTISDTFSQYNPGAQAHLIKDAAQKATDGSVLQLKTGFVYGSWSGFTRVGAVNLSATGILGSAGYSFDYDNSGRWLTSIQAQGMPYKEQEPTHDWGGRPLSQLDANGIQTIYEWDNLGRVKTISPQSPELPTSIVYDRDFLGALVTRGAASTHYRYDAFGELISIQKPTGETKTFTYDLGGRKRFESVWAGTAGTNTYYDLQGRTKQTVNANGEVTDFTYSTPLLSSVTTYPEIAGSPSSATTTFERDALGRLAKVTDAKGQVTNYKYDPAGRLSRVQQGSLIRTWDYNGLGWLTELQQPESGATTYSDFSIFGKPRIANYAERVVNTTYDALGRATYVNAVDGSVAQHFEFDGGAPFNGKVRYTTDKGVRLDYGYGGLNGRLDSLTTTLNPIQGAVVPPFTQHFGYDNYGFRTSATLPSGRVLTYAHDPIQDVAQQVGYLGTTVASLLDFNAEGMPKKVQYGNGGNGAFTTLAYDVDGTRLKTMAHNTSAPGGPLEQWTYSYDPAGRLSTDGEDFYHYDSLGRLLDASVKGLPDVYGNRPTINQAFEYDGFGNRTSSTFPTGVPAALIKNLVPAIFSKTDPALLKNQLPAMAGSAATGSHYTPQGFLDRIFKRPGDATSQMNLTYDALGRVVISDDTERSAVEIYSYNPDGLRTVVEYYKYSVLQKIRYSLYNDQRQLVSQFDWLPDVSNPPTLHQRLGAQTTPRLAFRKGGAK